MTADYGTTEIIKGISTDTLGYNGNILGPTIRSKNGEKIIIHVNNNLEDSTTVHWHGLIVPGEMDGGPHQIIKEGESWGIVGESGSGKSVACKTIMRILSANGFIKDGEILFENRDLTKLSEREMEKVRGKDMAMIFQDPMTSLNPTMTIGKQIMEPIIKHQGLSKEEAKVKAIELINLVGISEPEKRFKQYPHQFSGGMRQRIVIAISLACNPKILIADEPTTALDVTIQAQILELIKDLQARTGVAVIFITHDLGVVANMADRVAVMYAGKIIEYGTSDDIFYNPQHPYTWGLLGSMPTLDIGDNDLYNIPGTPPDLMNPPKGDAFALRSEFAIKLDHLAEPPMFKISDTHYAATWLLHPLAKKVERPLNIERRKVNADE
ncbi:Vitamin B12 import ATP-binding protein BtuD [bioreactor metagenome]|uniref:Vitamin B12 import ATP-binding protein BtuD n=1 Tax=bioreactor metagenome TaxID=1076179 RepID=A0A645DCS1_9ZZZZ